MSSEIYTKTIGKVRVIIYTQDEGFYLLEVYLGRTRLKQESFHSLQAAKVSGLADAAILNLKNFQK